MLSGTTEGIKEFVSEILSGTEESFERRYALKASGVDINLIAKRVATLLDITENDVWREGQIKAAPHPHPSQQDLKCLIGYF
jgi:hypothetical protein